MPHLFALSVQHPWAAYVLKRATTSGSSPFHIPTTFQLPNQVLTLKFITQEFQPWQLLLRALNSSPASMYIDGRWGESLPLSWS